MSKIKNLIIILVIILLGITSYYTAIFAGKSISSSQEQGMLGGNQNNQSAPPSMPDGNNSNAPQRPDSSNATGEEDGNTSSEMPNESNQNGEAPPARPGENDSSDHQMPSGMPGDVMHSNNTIGIVYYILFGIESLIISGLVIYLIMSKFNKMTFKEVFMIRDKIIIYVLSTILLTSGLTFADGIMAKNLFSSSSNGSYQTSSSDVKANGATVVNGTNETLNDTYNSTSSDENAILVQNGGSANIDGATIEKSGDSTNTENSEFYGINSGILVKKGSTAVINKSNITTSSKGSNAVFATGENAKIEISDSNITTTGSSSARGLDATYGGYIKANNVTIKTSGGSSATLATDRGEGTVIANNSNLETNGSGSPIIYSTGSISIDNTSGVANGSQMVVIEGKNSATVTNSTLKASGKGNRGEIDNAGVMIYQSMSGDASEGTGTFTAKNSTLIIDSNSNYYTKAPMFFITNTDAVINLEDTKLSFGSGLLISSKGTSEWGNSGSNGGNLVLNATNQELDGDIEVDSISSLSLNLVSSSYKGTINSDNSAKEISLKLDKNSEITLTGDSYVTNLEDADSTYSNIKFNGFKLYVNGKAIN